MNVSCAGVGLHLGVVVAERGLHVALVDVADSPASFTDTAALAEEAKAMGAAIAARATRPRILLRMLDGAFRVGRVIRNRGWRCSVALLCLSTRC